MFIKKEIAIIILLLTTMFFGCTPEDYSSYISSLPDDTFTEFEKHSVEKEEPILVEKKDILQLVNNEKIADDLIKNTYSEEMLLKLDTRIDNLLVNTPPECVRMSNDKVYIIFKSTAGNYMFLFYSLSESLVCPVEQWYCGNKFYLKDIKKIIEGKTTLDEVQKFDPYGSYDSLYASSTTSFYSYHHTIDGYKIRVDYSLEIGKPIVVNKITILSGVNNPIYYNLLQIDKELISKSR